VKSNIVIFGSSRSGKTTLAKKIVKEFHFCYISIDRIVTGFQYGMPELNINHEDRSGKTVKLLSPFLLNFIKSLDSNSLRKDNIFYVIEGAYLDINEYINFFRKRNIKLIITLQTELKKQDFFNNIRKYDKDNEWTTKMSDDELLEYCDNLVLFNRNIKKYCDENDIKYYDTSFNRNEIIEEIINEIRVDF
jgi:adenylate kinase family enzyme